MERDWLSRNSNTCGPVRNLHQTDFRPLTRTQQTVAERPADSYSLVLGGPGTGKTHLLIARIAKLLSVDGLAPGHEVVLLTFGRETAAELRRRAAAEGGATAYVRASTFDSFATELLASVEPGGIWTTQSYDQRIATADRLMQSERRAQSYLSRFRHVIVDEIQDLVGLRAGLVLTLLKFANCGFTLLGDPAQAIYNFQLSGRDRERGSEPLFEELEASYTSLETFTLDENFRAQSDETKSTLKFGAMLMRCSADYREVLRGLETHLLSAKPAPMNFLDRREGTTAVLCHTNVQALMISERLTQNGVGHEYRRALSDGAMAPWIGQVLGLTTARQLSRRALIELLDNANDSPSADEAWMTLKSMDPGSGNALRVDRIAEKIRSGVLKIDPFPPRQRITVSTIHRAKGLEFDWVVVGKPRFRELERGWIAAEEARLLFVALTRARKGLFSFDPEDTRGWRASSDRVEGRWTLMRPGMSHIEALEVRGSDVRTDEAPGFMPECSDGAAEQTQRYIRESVKSGDPVCLVLNGNPGGLEDEQRYLVIHEGTIVGESSDVFAAALERARLPRRKGRQVKPVRIEGLRIESVDTVAGTRAASERAGLPGFGVWNRVRIFGLGSLIYPPAGSGDGTVTGTRGSGG